MIDERIYKLLCSQLGLANEEKAGLCKQVNESVERLKAIEESNKEGSKALMDTINELSAAVENYRKELELMRKRLEAKDKVNRMLANGAFESTMEHPLKNLGEILYPQLLARLLYLKYDFNMPENRQIRLLAREGVPYKQQHAEQLSP